MARKYTIRSKEEKLAIVKEALAGKLVRALRLYTTGEYTLKEIEELTGVKKSTLYRYMKEQAKDL